MATSSFKQPGFESAISSLDQSFQWVVGAAIFKANDDGPSSSPPRVLLVKRSAEETAFPSLWEFPSGKVEKSDASIAAALSREVMEETGLEVIHPVTALDNMEWAGKTRRSVQLNWIVRVKSTQEVTLNPLEHSENAWVAREELAEYSMTEEMRKLVTNAFVTAQGVAEL